MANVAESIVEAIKSAEFTKGAIRKAIEPFIGQPGQPTEIHFGTVPTDRLQVISNDGVISKIRWWSGLKWTARGGYGSPSVEVE